MEQRVFCQSSLQSGGRYKWTKTVNKDDTGLMSCASASKQHGKNWTSALSILQSGSGEVAFVHVSRQKATTLSTSCLDWTMKCQTNFSIVAFWQLVFITISEFLIKCVVSYIAHDIHDRVELITHCFSQYCDSKVWNFCCVWCSIS